MVVEVRREAAPLPVPVPAANALLLLLVVEIERLEAAVARDDKARPPEEVGAGTAAAAAGRPIIEAGGDSGMRPPGATSGMGESVRKEMSEGSDNDRSRSAGLAAGGGGVVAAAAAVAVEEGEEGGRAAEDIALFPP